MKIIKNAKKARCTSCFFGSAAVLVDGVAVCNRCGRQDLFDVETYGPFVPEFGDDPAATYQASRYTPKLPERRSANRPWPKIKERRSTAPLFV